MTARTSRCYDSSMPLLNIFDYEELARRKLSKPFFEYIAGGADDETTLRRNREAFERIELSPRALVDVSHVDLTTSVLGQAVEMPVLLAPVAVQRLAHPEGELATAGAAAQAGTIMTLSTMASASIEEVASASNGPKWFQLYVHRDRNVSKSMVQRADAVGYKAVCLTVDVPRLGRRERDLRNRLEYPPGVAHQNYIGEVELPPLEVGAGESELSASADVLIDPALTWEVIDWLRSFTSLPVIVKGIMTAEDARFAVDHGASAIVVSNHGGRQLDGAPASISVLPEIAAAVDGRCEVLLDSGIRRGTDIVKALALGANAVLIGRAYIWGLAVAGEDGVTQVLSILRNELELAMALCGCRSVAEVGAEVVYSQARPD
ncbi:MAG: alpha-hydroxy-acid oxidizing protein [Chloroflexi bacterium]|nr:MAG: alpha-hydroxy-acid oxidizing protein [Chloroflexota bacterium]